MNQKKPTVLFLASWYPTASNKNHGIFIKNHALALSKFTKVIVLFSFASNEKEIYTISKSNINSNLEEWILPYKKVNSTIPLFSSLLKLLRFKTAYKKLRNELILKKIQIDAIQLNTIFPAAIILSLFKNQFKVPHAIVEHWSGYLPEDGNYKGFILKYFTKKAISSATKVFYVSEKQKLAMQFHKLKGNYELLYNVIDTELFFQKKETNSSKPILLHVSSLVEKEKNISGTLNVLKNLQEKGYDFDSIFLGGTSTFVNDFESKAKELKIKSIQFLGEKRQKEIASYMQSADALILFSNYEGMPVVVLEALACGLPVFASRVGHLPFMVNPSFGVLVNTNNDDELTRELELFLDKKLVFDSDKMLNFISENASMQVVGEKLFNFYKGLAASSINLVSSTN